MQPVYIYSNLLCFCPCEESVHLVCDVTSHFFKNGSFSSCITSMFVLVVCSLDDTSASKMVYFRSCCEISV